MKELGTVLTDDGRQYEVLLDCNKIHIQGNIYQEEIDANSLVGQIILNLCDTYLAPSCCECSSWTDEMYCIDCASDRFE